MICYHITTEDRLPSILKNGLQPNSDANRSARKAPHIMLSKYPAWQLYKNWKKNQAKVLIEIKMPISLGKTELFNSDPEGIAWDKPIPPMYFTNIIKYEVLK